MKDNYTSSTKLIVDTISFDRLFMYKLERTNDIKRRVYSICIKTDRKK